MRTKKIENPVMSSPHPHPSLRVRDVIEALQRHDPDDLVEIGWLVSDDNDSFSFDYSPVIDIAVRYDGRRAAVLRGE